MNLRHRFVYFAILLSIFFHNNAVSAQSVCGNGVLELGEECEGTNDLKCKLCIIQAPYMCINARRSIQNVIGKQVEWQTNVNVAGGRELVLRSPEVAEQCMEINLGVVGGMYQPITVTAVEKDFFYAIVTCNLFPADNFFEFKDSCTQSPIDECVTGKSNCDTNAFCIEPVDKIGYSCECNPDYFVGKLHGELCYESGVEIIVKITGKVGGDPQDRANMISLRRSIIQMLIDDNYIRTGSGYPFVTIGLVEEGLKYYVIDEDTLVQDTPDFVGRKIWSIVIRVATMYLDMSLISNAPIFNQYNTFKNRLASLNAPLTDTEYIVHRMRKCSNDNYRSCTTDEHCLDEGICVIKPDVSIEILTSGGSSSPLAVSASSSSVLSVTYDAAQEMLNIRMRYSTRDDNVTNIVYIPSVVPPVSPLESATFNSEEFPCLPLGTGSVVQDQENTVCCLKRFENRYTTIVDFGTFVDGSTFTQQIAAQSACVAPNSPPSQNSIDIFSSNVDFISGTFKNMPRSKAEVDPTNTRGYKDVMLLLAIEDIQTKGAIVTQIPMGKKLVFFVGMLHVKGMKSNRISAAHSQSIVEVDITENYFSPTTSPTTSAGSFIQDVSVLLREIKDCCSENTLKFATITVIVPSIVYSNDPINVVALSSIVAAKGFFRTDQTAKMYPCMGFYSGSNKELIDTTMQNNSWCGLREPICIAKSYGSSAIGPGGTVTFTIPLPNTMWDKNKIVEDNLKIAESLFIDFMIIVSNVNDNSILMTTLQTKTKLTSTSILTMCTETPVVGGIENIMNIDIFLGLAGNENEFESGLLKTLNFSKTSPPMVRDVSTKESNVMTLLFKGSNSVFDKDFASSYTLAVEDIVTIHIINLGKLAQVQALMNSGSAYSVQQNTDPALGTVAKLVPSAALLALCPYQTIRQNFGCISRREITQRKIDFSKNSIVPLTARGNSASDKESVHMRTGLWTQKLLGGSQYAKELGYNHSKLMHNKNNLNSRYRNGFLIAPTIPWSKAQLENERISSIMDMAQNTITTMLLSYDKNVNIVYDPVVELVMPLNIAASESEIIANQLAIANKFAEGADMDPNSVTIDISTILTANADIRRRRLLASDPVHQSTFNMRITFGGDEVYSTLETALEFKKIFEDKMSLQSKNIVSTVNTLMAETIPSFFSRDTLLDETNSILNPQKIEKCFDDQKWEIDVTNILKLDTGTKQVGYLSCARRRIMSSSPDSVENVIDYNIDVRGPRTVEDWLLISRDHVLDKTQWMHGWEWWDFCANAPKNTPHDSVFQEAWQNIRALASQKCCMCNRVPKYTETSKSYKQEYSWPLVLQDNTIHDVYSRLSYSLHSDQLNSIYYKINPQIRNFRIGSAASVMLFETQQAYRGNTLPPLAWDVDDIGHTVLPSCGPGQWLSGMDWCELCPNNSYKKGDRNHLDTGGVCDLCPLNSLSHSGSTSVHECLCDKGFFYNNDKKCTICPAGTFKATISNIDACVPCSNGYRARTGSASELNCADPELSGTFNMYNDKLGLLYYQTKVNPTWIHTPAIQQDQHRMCALIDDRSTLDCGGANVYSTTEIKHYYNSNRNNNRISLFQRPGYMGPSPPGFHEKISNVAKWTSGTVLKTNLRLQMRTIDFSQVHSGNDVYFVNFITSKKLDGDPTSVDWNWILCGQKLPGSLTSTYSFCRNQEDPDNPGVRNYENNHVLDGNIVLLNGEACCDSCYYNNAWMPDCLEKTLNPDKKNLYDNELSWIPFTKTKVPQNSNDLWMYTIFVVGESEACIRHNCDESMILKNLQQHIKTQTFPIRDIIVDLLPGTSFQIEVPPPKLLVDIVQLGAAIDYVDAINGAGYARQVNVPDGWKPGMSIEITSGIFLDKLQTEYGNDLRMNIFMSSKLLGTEESDWISCGSKKHNLEALSSTSISTVANRQTFSSFFTDTLVQQKLGMHNLHIENLATMFLTSNNAWKSTGGFLPDPAMCEPSSKSCKPGQMVFPGGEDIAVVSGYSRCNLHVSLDHQSLPCMYTVGDIVDKYSIVQEDLNQVHHGGMQSMYESDTGYERNVRAVHNDTYTKKIAFGSISNPSFSEMLYLCHTQYNNLPDNVLDKKSLRPNIACAVSGDMDLTSVHDCVCGIVARVYKMSDQFPEQYDEKIVRIIPQTVEENVYNTEIPMNIFLTELNQDAIFNSDVLSAGVFESVKDTVQFYSASNPADMQTEVSVPVSNIQFSYHMCENEVDPDNTFSLNMRNEYLLDGIVVPFGKIYNSASKPDTSCCNLFETYPQDFDINRYCSEQCETDGPYEVKAGTIKWTPTIAENANSKQEYWLYVAYFIGDSVACQHLNCDEQHQRAQLTTSTVLSQLQFWHTTTVKLNAPDILYLPSRKLLSDFTKPTKTPIKVGKRWGARKYVKNTIIIPRITAKNRNNNEAVYNVRATQNIKNQQRFDSRNAGVNPAETQNTRNRMLLAIEAPTNTENDAKSRSCSTEISSINNNNQVIQIVCRDPYLCDMLSINREVPVADFCTGEDDFIAKYLPKLRSEIIMASAGSISEVYITSVISPGSHNVCASSQTRKLLQTETVQLTVIVQGSAVYVMDNTILDEFGNVNFTKVSGISNLTMVRCDSPAGCVDARRIIGKVLNFTNTPSTPKMSPIQDAFVTNTQPESTSDWLIIPIAVILAIACLIVICVYYYNSQQRKSTPEQGDALERQRIIVENPVEDQKFMGFYNHTSRPNHSKAQSLPTTRAYSAY